MSDSTPPPPSSPKRVLKRVAQFGFLFFLLKGLGWLVVGWLAWQGLSCQADLRVTGTIAYRERIAMPPGAVIEVSLEDVSRADAPATVLGTVTIEDPGNVPVAFEIPYDPDDIDERGSYSVRARIVVDGRPRWGSAAANPVLTRGNDASVDILLTAAGAEGEQDGVGEAAADVERAYIEARDEPGQELLVEIEGEYAMRAGMEGGPRPTVLVRRLIGFTPRETCRDPMSSADLTEIYWKLTRIGDRAVEMADAQREPYMTFREATGRVEGSGGCNRFGGNYTVEGSTIAITGTVSTMMACTEGMETEAEFLAALERARSWRIEGIHLELYDEAGDRLARFEATHMD